MPHILWITTLWPDPRNGWGSGVCFSWHFRVEWLDKTTRVICTRGHQCNLHLGYQLADDGSESSLREGTRLEGTLRCGAQVSILCKPMLKGGCVRVTDIDMRLTKRLLSLSIWFHERTFAIASGRGSPLLLQFSYACNHKLERQTILS
jgi:hypothetical protein